jgi:hypothetical protein
MLKILRRLNSFIGIRLFYVVFLASLGFWLYQWNLFREVESWPWVEAKLVDSASEYLPFRLETRTGSRVSGVLLEAVEFGYVVDGIPYQGDLGTPDGGGVKHSIEVTPDFQLKRELRAYYKPDQPELAVLSPEPYAGLGLLAIATTVGIPVLVHLAFWLKGR